MSKALQKLGVNRTRVIVAHRLSTVMNVDKIVVMKDGCKVEEGSFEELVEKRNGIFRDMWKRQQRGESESGDANDVDENDPFSMNGGEPAYAIRAERQCDEDAENEEVWHETAEH